MIKTFEVIIVLRRNLDTFNHHHWLLVDTRVYNYYFETFDVSIRQRRQESILTRKYWRQRNAISSVLYARDIYWWGSN